MATPKAFDHSLPPSDPNSASQDKPQAGGASEHQGGVGRDIEEMRNAEQPALVGEVVVCLRLGKRRQRKDRQERHQRERGEEREAPVARPGTHAPDDGRCSGLMACFHWSFGGQDSYSVVSMDACAFLGMDRATELDGEFLKVMQGELVILLGIETDRAMVAALDDVPRYPRNREAGATWHEEFSVTDRLHI